ncbi:glycosyltransferase family 8 protein [Deferribacterales bacterium RsTz2092]|nr:general stress protein A [Deferribacterales bacterium]
MIPVVFVADDNYAPYLGVAISSFVSNASVQNTYNIYIVHDGISDGNRELLETLSDYNVQIDFIDARPFVASYGLDQLNITCYPLAIYYRFFLPQILPELDKVLYLDTDVLILDDVVELYNIDIGNNYIGVVLDALSRRPASSSFAKYCRKILNIASHKTYFNSGVLLMNLAKMRTDDMTTKLVATQKKMRNARFPDQDTLNIVFEGKTSFLPDGWNVQAKEFYPASLQIPSIVHYATNNKPWAIKNPRDNLLLWWQQAEKTPFYEILQHIKPDTTTLSWRWALLRDKLKGSICK